MRRLKYYAILFVCTILCWANFSNPPNGATGAPGDSSCDQSGCHSSPSATIDGEIGISGLPEVIEAGTSYNLIVNLTAVSGEPVFGGFQMTVLDQQDDFIGTLETMDENAGLATSGNRTYVEHNDAKRFFDSTTVFYTADWTAPAELLASTITFYIAANFANGNGTNSGDHIELSNFAFEVPMLVDNDNDGFDESEDCNDMDASINPDATEIPNNDVDEDCDGVALQIDEDDDGFNSDLDCNDNDPLINPDATEIPNNDVDEDCDGVALQIDEDDDGFNSDLDCNDNDPLINPDATEIANNDVDEDCDGVALQVDEDSDGFNSDQDCNDSDALINPDATEIPNNDVDEDCDGVALQIDEDDDGFNSDQDCNDSDALINPDATEIPNNDVDEDCDGVALQIDEDDDGFNSDQDCNDNDPLINPDATEIPDNDVDENCDGVIATAADSLLTSITISTADGTVLSNVVVSFSDPGLADLTTGADGTISFSPPADTIPLTLTFSKNDDPSNGLTGLDIVILKRHILDLAPIQDSLLLRAADVNANGSVSVIDIVQIRNIILGFWDSFPNKNSWEFEPATITVSSEDVGTNIVITAIKTGDVNRSAKTE